MVAADGTTKLDETRTATYAVYQPNGSDCDPTCHSTVFDVTP
jgi:hypothetical protein